MEALPFPPGANSSDTAVAPGLHFNLTTLTFWNYTLYGNATLSNGSECVIVSAAIAPLPVGLLANGTFVNGTSCFDTVSPIGRRGAVSCGLAVLFATGLVLALACLNRHGAVLLPYSARFRPVSRRWPWYWACVVSVAGVISLLMNVDVDRTYLLDFQIIITAFVWFLLQIAATALVWEAVRHWGSWEERKTVDLLPFALRSDSTRASVEFWLPIWFYLWLWLDFFLVIPRTWSSLSLQRSPDQTAAEAIPLATDTRFKAASFCLLICALTCVVSLVHSLWHYRPAATRSDAHPHPHPLAVLAPARRTPLRLIVQIILAFAMAIYQSISSFFFSVSVLDAKGNLPAIFVAGYLPSLIILYTQIAYGFASPNEDAELLRRRRLYTDAEARELGFVRKPAWWRLGSTGPVPAPSYNLDPVSLPPGPVSDAPPPYLHPIITSPSPPPSFTTQFDGAEKEAAAQETPVTPAIAATRSDPPPVQVVRSMLDV